MATRINYEVERCAKKYNLRIDINPTNELNSMARLADAVGDAGGQLYVIIDEYDRFANKLMFENPELYKTIVAGETRVLGSSPIRSFFETLKMLTATHGVRSFATGVTPIALADASGANDRVDLSNDEDFADVCGFTEADIKRGLSLIAHMSDEERDRALVMMREYYNSYLFEGSTLLYNSTLSLYFLDKLAKKPGLVNKLEKMSDVKRLLAMVDANVNVSQNVINFLRHVPQGPETIFEFALAGDKPVANINLLPSMRLSELVSPSYHDLVRQRDRVASMLYFQGVVTGTEPDYDLKLANRVAREHFIEQLPRLSDTNDVAKATESPTIENWTALVSKAFKQTTTETLMNNDTTEADVQMALGSALVKALYGVGEVKAESFLKGAGRSDLIAFDKNNNGVLIEIGRLRPKHLLFADADLNDLEPISSDEAKAMARELRAAYRLRTLKDMNLASKVEGASTVGEFVSKKCNQALGYVESAKAKYNLRQLKAFAVISVGDQFIVEECDK